MDHREALILAAALLCGTAHAGYAQATPPVAWSAGGGAGGSWVTGTSASNSASYANGNVRTNASLNVGGRSVTIPASARFAANAARVAGAAVFMNPYVRGAAAVATWLGAAGLVYDVASGLWSSPDNDSTFPVSDGYRYSYADSSLSAKYGIQPDLQTACSVFKNHFSHLSIVSVSCLTTSVVITDKDGYRYSTGFYRSAYENCPSGWFITSAGCVQTPPPKSVTQEQFVEQITKTPMPANVPSEVPGRYPIELPTVDPTFIPTGNPQKNPSYDPSAPASESNQPYVQPGVRVEPAPVASAPWQVSLTPVERPTSSPAPNPNPSPDGGAKDGDKPREDDRDFCDKHPNVIACQELEPPDDPGGLPTKEVDVQITPETGFAGLAVCPPPLVLRDITFSWQPFCDALAMARNVLLAFAWLSAAFILLGAKTE